MEAFALLKIQKKNKLLAENEGKEHGIVGQLVSKANTANKKMSREESNAIARQLGFPIPPECVYAIGKSGCAAVWWSHSPDDEELTSWEVHRYRKDAGVFNYKGYQVVEALHSRNQCIVTELNNDHEYKFTVKAVNMKGASSESEFSNPVIVEVPLPNGWFRFYNDKSHRFYYANIRSQQSSWSRPGNVYNCFCVCTLFHVRYHISLIYRRRSILFGRICNGQFPYERDQCFKGVV